MNVRRMLVVGFMVLTTMGLWAQDAAKKPAAEAGGHKKMAAKSGGGVEEALMDMERKWSEAGKSGDATVLESILSDNWMAMNADGTYQTKKDALANLKKSKWEINEVSNMKVHSHGNYAQVIGDWRGKGTDEKGKAVDTTEHWIDTFMKMPSGKWQAISSGSVTAK